jgi:hypothetical protein
MSQSLRFDLELIMGLVCFRDTSFLASLLLDWEMNMSGLNLIFLALGDFFFFFFLLRSSKGYQKNEPKDERSFLIMVIYA